MHEQNRNLYHFYTKLVMPNQAELEAYRSIRIMEVTLSNLMSMILKMSNKNHLLGRDRPQELTFNVQIIWTS